MIIIDLSIMIKNEKSNYILNNINVWIYWFIIDLLIMIKSEQTTTFEMYGFID